MRHWTYLTIGGLALVLAGCGAASEARQTVKLFKSPTCGCCVGWKAHMEENGYGVGSVNRTDMDAVKRRYRVPRSVESCHTALIGNYVIEGHVPHQVIERLLVEQPDIDGIALPNMPPGSPGMPGPKTETWTIYAFKDGKLSEYTRL